MANSKPMMKINAIPAGILPIVLALLITGCTTPTKPPGAPGSDPLGLGNPKAGFTVMLRSERPAANRYGWPYKLLPPAISISMLSIHLTRPASC